MTTKEQERKALAQIRKIIDGLDAGSYIEIALEGCLEIAEENIENDFAGSMKQRVETAEQEADLLRKKLAKQEERLCMQAAELSLTKQSMQLEQERANKAWEQNREQYAKLNEQSERLVALENRNAVLEDEVIHLKAKLYDMMTK